MAPSNVENFSPHVIKQISRELCDLTQNPLEGIRVVFNEDDITSVQADIDGPYDTPYFGGSFRIRLVLGKNFPTSPPKGFFVTKIFHPNVGRNGEICVNTLKKDWNQDLGIKHILLTIKCLLIVPNPESALNEEAGKMLLEQYEDYCKRAKMMTEIHAPKAKITANDYNDDCQQPSSSSVNISNNIVTSSTTITTTATTTTSSTTNTNNNNNTLYDKTASSSTSANIGSCGNGSQKQPLDGVCCSEEPVTKRLNSILDCYNSTADQQQQQQLQLQQTNSQQSLQKSSVSQASSQQSSTQSKVSGTSAISNKNRGLKRVLRLRS